MEMSFDQAGRKVRAFKIDNFFSFVIADANDAFVINGHISIVNLAAENIDDARVLEQQLRGFLASRDSEFVLRFSHERTCSAVTCSVFSPVPVAPTLPAIAFDI